MLPLSRVPGGMVLDEIDTCINSRLVAIFPKYPFKAPFEPQKLPQGALLLVLSPSFLQGPDISLFGGASFVWRREKFISPRTK